MIGYWEIWSSGDGSTLLTTQAREEDPGCVEGERMIAGFSSDNEGVARRIYNMLTKGEIVDEPKYNHVEAFCLMKYQTLDGRETEILWNSRDGVTPFCIVSKSGKEMRHVDWRSDKQVVDYQPKPGERIFKDMSPERAREIAAKRVERWWDDPEYPIKDKFPSKEAAVEDLLKSSDLAPGAPDVVEVQPTPPE
jgi:hypothetical protein